MSLLNYMKKILCLTDFSPASQKAVQYAAWLSQRCGATLTLLHVVQLHLLENEDAVAANAQTVGAQMHMAERTLHDTCEQLKQNFKGDDKMHPLPCNSMVREGLLTEVVGEIYEQGNTNLIIMGTTGGGADRLEHMLLGSNTLKVMESVHCPVLAIPIGCQSFHLEKIVFASSYHKRDYDAIAKILPIAQCLNSQIHIVHVGKDDSKEEQARYRQFCQPIAQQLSYDKIHFNLITHDDAEEGLLTYVKQMRGDMIALLAKEKGFLGRFFHQSMVEQVAYHSKVPFLILHEDDLDKSE